MLDFGTGSGRNADALAAAGHRIVRIDDRAAALPAPLPSAPGGFAAVVATHALLHGTPAEIAARLSALAESLGRGGLLYAVFASTRDRRFERGTRLAPYTFAPDDGDERGVPHTYFDRGRLRALLEERFALESLRECAADGIAGRWAHPSSPLTGAVHWFAIGRRLSRLPRQT